MLVRLACAVALLCASTAAALAAGQPPTSRYDEMVAEHARSHGLPEKLVHRVIMRESRYNARAMHSRYWGLMQITYATAKSMGYRGKPTGLLDPDVNLTYAVPYLANAYKVAGGDENRAVRLYASGYYASAKKARLLADLRTADSAPIKPATARTAAPAAQPSLFAMMFGAAPSVSADQYTATTDAAAPDEGAEDATLFADVPLPPHRPRHLGRTITAANR
ncbi:MAG: lytic transglycosylase domain-containing protein [Methylobacteriaceae bacterium]|nr:lytic transglycosylase domain-containing protein [Methylobacteriaceae bacterium]